MLNLVGINKQVLAATNYVRKASPATFYWFSIYRSQLERYKDRFGSDFHIIFWGDPQIEADYFTIPYAALQDTFVESFLAADKANIVRWVGRIKHNQLKISNCPWKVDVSDFYGRNNILQLTALPSQKMASLGIKEPRVNYIADTAANESDENEFAIENKRREILARQKQSKFRRQVLKNFNSRCCLTNIGETELLIASHIIPWSHRIATRLDPRNGLCLSALYDRLFDQGFISLDDQLRVLVTDTHEELSQSLRKMLDDIRGKQINEPRFHQIDLSFLEYHRSMFDHGWT